MKLTNKFVILGLIACFGACAGATYNEKKKENEQAPEVDQPEEVAPTSNNLELSDTQTVDLELTGTQFVGVVDQCRSGFNMTWTEGSEFFVQDGDLDCQFRLVELAIDGELYRFDEGLVWDEGATISAAGEAGTSRTFQVVKNFDPVIEGPQEIIIQSFQATIGNGIAYSPDLPSGVKIEYNKPLALEISSFQVGVAKTGGGDFQFILGCQMAVTPEGTCDGILLNSLGASLTVKTLDFVPSWEHCQSSLTQAGIALDGFANIYTPESMALLPLGGLEIPSILGPDRLYDPINSQLILTLGNEMVCKYFEIHLDMAGAYRKRFL